MERVTYEIAPQLHEQLWLPMSLWVSRHILALEGNVTQYKLLGLEYMRTMVTVQILESGMDGIAGMRMNPQTRANPRVLRGRNERLDFDRW